ncbi:sigma-70 family RNA polymerase sigma factor [Rhabdobacter roseus]|uniref:RNA polymerase sigma-70 factor (ECF subfamily) n=1 Tax=Rhabdobacter roseus TaxID=1655419 RepID=A0A840TH48_9BACT|nr:sigma-70 family RNA polymerase sigma factor [Rhabdobacter roseus]MBB5282571.1 RNA polymerase sigma-70 factor (ECF subfamily) [Rhabdobacter roseus]
MATQKVKYSEEDLVASLKRNERAAFDYLYDHYSGALFNVVCKVLKDSERSEDVMQDVFLKIWKSIASYNSEKGRLFTWMLNIARNSAIDAVRAEGRAPIMDDIQEHSAWADQSAVYQPSLSTLDLKALVEKLRPERKILVDLVYFQGYTQEEVAEKLSIPLGTVKSRIRTALQDLKIFFAV